MKQFSFEGDAFDLAFFIDQKVNINRIPLIEAVESATKLFLQLYPKWRSVPYEEVVEMGMKEFRSWQTSEGSEFLRKG